jgi:hypothetical protein
MVTLAVIISKQRTPLDVYCEIKDRLIDMFEAMEPTKPATSYTTARKFMRFIDGVLLEYEDPEALEISIEPHSRTMQVTIMTPNGFFNFVAYKKYDDDYKFNSNYVSHFQVVDYYERIHPKKNQIDTFNNLSHTKSTSKDADYFDAWSITSERVNALLQIRVLLHDHSVTWAIKIIAAYRIYFPDHQYDTIKNKTHPIDREKANSYTYEASQWIFDNKSKWEFSNEHKEFDNNDFGSLNESIRFIIDTEQLTWNAKGILAYLIFYKAIRSVTIEEVYKSARNKHNSTPKGLKNLIDSGYVSESPMGILNITNLLYKETKKYRDSYDTAVRNIIESQSYRETEAMEVEGGGPYRIEKDSFAHNPYLYSSRQNNESKERAPVTGHVYLVKSPDMNLYGFRTSKGFIIPELHALRFDQQKLEVISYFETDDINRMITFVRKNFEDKKVRVDYRKWDNLAQYNWYDLVKEDVLKITDGTFSELMKNKLIQNEKMKNDFLTPGGYVMLFRDEYNAYHLRTTTKANPQNLIWRGSNERITPVIGFLTKDVENLRTHFHEEFKNEKELNGNKEKYLFDEEDVIQRIQSLAMNEKLQINEVITSF